MLKVAFYIFCGLSSLVFFIYTIKSNSQIIKSKILQTIFVPYVDEVKGSVLIIYPFVSNPSKKDNSVINFELELNCGMGYFRVNQIIGIEDFMNVIPIKSIESDEITLLVDLKKKLICNNNPIITSNTAIHGYLFFALEKGFYFDNIESYRLTVTDIFQNKFFNELTKKQIDSTVEMFYQKSNAKVYKPHEYNLMVEMINKYK